MKKYYTLSEVSKLTNIKIFTLRFYAKEGLFPNVKRDENGTHLFVKEDFEWLFVIYSLKLSGMTIKKIKNYVKLVTQGDETLAQRLAIFQLQKQDVAEKIDELKMIQDVVEYKLWLYKQYVENGSSDPKLLVKTPIPKALTETREKLLQIQDANFIERKKVSKLLDVLKK